MRKIVSLLLILCLCAPALSLAQETASAPVWDGTARSFWKLLTGASDDDWICDTLLTGNARALLSPARLSALRSAAMSLGGEDWGFYGLESAQGDTLSQHISMRDTDLTLTITINDGLIARLSLLPADKAVWNTLPAGIAEESVTVGDDEWALEGVFTYPVGGENLPAVLLVQGSGPSDRDETVGHCKPLRDIAWMLAQQGVASLRYDKRTYAHADLITGETYEKFTIYDEIIDDASRAIDVLYEHPLVDPYRVYLAGHSLGAMASPLIIAENHDKLSGAILLCGTPRKLYDVIVRQNKDMIAALPDEYQEQYANLLNAEIKTFRSMDTLTQEEIDKTTVFGQPANYILSTLWNTPSLMSDLRIPLLIVNGGADCQIPADMGMEAWKTALEGVPFVTYAEYPSLNHLLMEYTGDSLYTGTVMEYYTANMADAGMARDIADWILAR